MTDLDAWQSVAVALAIGLLIGAERERSKHQNGSAGVRTFALVALVGVVSTMVPTVVAAVLVAGVAGLVGAAYWTGQASDRGLTSEIALLVTLALGALTPSEPALAVGLAVTVTVLLVSKEVLHRFLRDTVTDLEGTDALKFFVAAFIVLPLLPDTPVGPYDVLVPSRVWLLVVFITGIGWFGYAATRALGDRRGLLVAGLAGGFVSGTATTATMASKYRRDGVPLRSALAGSLTASVATLLQLVAVTVVIEPSLTLAVMPAVVGGGVVLALEAWWLVRQHGAVGDHSATAAGRPFALLPALILAAVISGVLLLATWLNETYGAAGALLATSTGALADFHASAAVLATLVRDAEISLDTALLALGLGLAVNTGSKLVVALVGGGARFTGLLLACFVPVGLVVAALLVLAG